MLCHRIGVDDAVRASKLMLLKRSRLAMAHLLSLHRIAVLVAAVILGSPAARAFTIDDGSGGYQVPKFDLEEQSRNFRAAKPDGSTSGQQQVETPVGKLQFGIQSGSSAFGAQSAERDRRHYERMFAPDFMKDRY
jgi:hypothetical protein